MAGVGLALPCVLRQGDQIITQVGRGEGIGHGLGVLLGGAHSDQIHIGIAIEIATGSRAEQQYLLDADALANSAVAHAFGVALQLGQPSLVPSLSDSLQG